MADKTVAQVVVETLAEIGVRHVFGVPSGGWVDYMEALRRTDGIDFVLTTHEGGAAFMATVCGRLTGVPGVGFGTFGPGATNLSTGVGCALLDRAPMIALTGVGPVPRVYGGHDIEHLDPPGDFRGTSAYRRHLADVLSARVLAELS